MYNDIFNEERTWIIILYYYKRLKKHPEFEVKQADVKKYWKDKWGLSPSALPIIKQLPGRIEGIIATEELYQVKAFRKDASVYLPTPPGDKKSSWISSDIMTKAREKGYAILKGKSKYSLSGFRISFRDQNGYFDNSDDRVVRGAAFDLTKDQVIDFIENAEPRYPQSQM